MLNCSADDGEALGQSSRGEGEWDFARSEFAQIPSVLLLAKSGRAARAVVGEGEIRRAEDRVVVLPRRKVFQPRIAEAKHFAGIEERRERRRVAKEEAVRAERGDFFPACSKNGASVSGTSLSCSTKGKIWRMSSSATSALERK